MGAAPGRTRSSGRQSPIEAVRLQTSLDGGLTMERLVVAATRMEPYDPFETPQIPGLFRAPAFNVLALDPTSGRLTFVWFGRLE